MNLHILNSDQLKSSLIGRLNQILKQFKINMKISPLYLKSLIIWKILLSPQDFSDILSGFHRSLIITIKHWSLGTHTCWCIKSDISGTIKSDAYTGKY